MAEHGGGPKFCRINMQLRPMAGIPSQIAYGGWQKKPPCHSAMASI